MTPVGTEIVSRGERRVVVQSWDADAFLRRLRMSNDAPGIVNSSAHQVAQMGDPDVLEGRAQRRAARARQVHRVSRGPGSRSKRA